MTDPIDTAAARRAWEETTQGEWHLVPYGDGDSIVICEDEAGNHRIAFMPVPGSRDQRERRLVWRQIKQNASFIARAHSEYPALLDEIERLRGENARLREAAAMAVAEMSRARGRLETIAMCNEDRRIAAALGGTCDFVRTAALGEKA